MPATEPGARLPDDDLDEIVHKLIPDALDIRDQHLLEGRHIVEYLEGFRITSQLTMEDLKDVAEYQWVPFPLHWTLLKTILPSLYMHGPRFMLRPRAEQHAAAATQREAYYNWSLREQNWDDECYYGIWNALVTGWGIWKVGFGNPWGDWPRNKQVITSGAPLANLTNAAVDAANPALGTSPTQGENGRQAPGTRKRPLLWPDQDIRPNNVWIKSVLPEDFAYDPESHNLRDARYAIMTLYMPRSRLERMAQRGIIKKSVNVDEIKAYRWYPNISEEQEPRDKMRGVHYLERFRQRKQKVDTVRLFEFWDRENGEYHLIADEYDETSLIDRKWPAPDEDYPFVMFGFNERQGRLYPQPELALLEPLAQQMNVLNSLAVEVSRKGKTVIALKKGMMNDEEIESLRSADPISIVQTSEDIRDCITVFPMTEMTKKDWIEDINRLWAQARNAIGVPEQEIGSSGGSGGEKATKSALLDRHSRMKQGFRKQVLLRALELVGRKYDKMWRSVWAHGVRTPEDELRVLLSPSEILKGQTGTNREGNPIQLGGLSIEEAESEMDVYIDPIAMTPIDKETLAGEILEDINIGAPLGAIDPFAAFEEVYRLRNTRMPHILRERPQLLDPLEEAILILQGVPVKPQPGEAVPRHAERHRMLVTKVQISLAKGGQPSGDPVVDAYVADTAAGGQALEGLLQHTAETEKMMPNQGQSTQDSAVASGRARESGSTKSGRAQSAAGVPFGAINTSVGQSMMGG